MTPTINKAVISYVPHLERLPNELLFAIAESLKDERDTAALALTSDGMFNRLRHLVHPTTSAWVAVNSCDRQQIFRMVRLYGLNNLRDAMARNIASKYALQGAICDHRHDIINLVIGLIPVGHKALCRLIVQAVHIESDVLTTFLLNGATQNQVQKTFRLICIEGFPFFIKFFLQFIPEDLRARVCTKVLSLIVIKEDTYSLTLLINGGATIDHRVALNPNFPTWSWTILQLLCSGNIKHFHSLESFCDFTTNLLQRGANVNVTSSQDRTQQSPLHLLALNGPASPRFGKNFSATIKIGRIEAAYKYLVKALIQHGADIDAQDSNGMTPLHLAVQSKERLMVKRMLKAGANTLIEEYIYGQRASRASDIEDLDRRHTILEAMVYKYEQNATGMFVEMDGHNEDSQDPVADVWRMD